MDVSGFTYKLRTQFSFIADDSTLSCIINSIAGQGISITGYLQTKLLKDRYHNNHNIVRLVVGSPEAEDISDLLGVRDVLESFNINFKEKSVIQVFQIISGIPGIIATLYGALWCKVIVDAFYIGEDNRFFIDVSDVCKAFEILNETPIKQCPEKCSNCQEQSMKRDFD
ncbi:hypothetical protein [Vallitalea okinawensis]|uniref:hypothetical protein n=1 Tax=Vallitalea okinawensis TaxID=2078660 RepID=UPI000CFB4AEC|nr:hypothetical protein [Vallitalea okinawensis]